MEQLNPNQNNCLHHEPTPRFRPVKEVGAALLVTLLFMGMQLLVTGAVTGVLALKKISAFGTLPGKEALHELLRSAVDEYATGAAAGADVMTLVTLLLFFYARNADPLASLGWRNAPKGRTFLLIPLGMGLNLAVSLLFALLPEAWLSSYRAAAEAAVGGTDFFSFLAVTVAVPITEETVFRSLVYGHLGHVLPRWAALLGQAMLFAVLHAHPVWIAYAFIIGIILGLVRDRYDSVWASILLHMGFNLTSFLPLLFGIQ